MNSNLFLLRLADGPFYFFFVLAALPVKHPGLQRCRRGPFCALKHHLIISVQLVLVPVDELGYDAPFVLLLHEQLLRRVNQTPVQCQ